MRKLSHDNPENGNVNESMNEEYLSAKLHLVDLAGSERAKRTGSDGIRFKEGWLSSYSITASLISLLFKA